MFPEEMAELSTILTLYTGISIDLEYSANHFSSSLTEPSEEGVHLYKSGVPLLKSVPEVPF